MAATMMDALVEITGDEGKAFQALEMLVAMVERQAESHGEESDEYRQVFDVLYDGLHKEYIEW